jgi:hypothetical protein
MIDGEQANVLCLVFDTQRPEIRAVAVGETTREARVRALGLAIFAPPEPFEPGVPEIVVCAPGDADEVRDDLVAALDERADFAPPPVVEDAMTAQVEALVDEVVAHFDTAATKGPSDEEWAVLVRQTLAYARREPWDGWPDDLQLRADLTVGDSNESYVVAVLGAEEMLAGLVLYPGQDQSDVPMPAEDWEPTDPLPFRPGSLLLHLNPPDDTVEELAEVAVESGWPPDAELMPVWLSAGPEGFADLEGVEAARLSLALAGVLARVAQPLATPSVAITGMLTLAGDGEGRYTVTDLPRGVRS